MYNLLIENVMHVHATGFDGCDRAKLSAGMRRAAPEGHSLLPAHTLRLGNDDQGSTIRARNSLATGSRQS